MNAKTKPARGLIVAAAGCALACAGAAAAQSVEDQAQAMRDAIQRESDAIHDAASGRASPPDTQRDDDDAAMAARNRTDGDGRPEGARDDDDDTPRGGGGGRGGSWDVNAMLGAWTIAEKDGARACTVTLYADESFGLRRAWSSGNCPDDFQRVMRWRAAGGDVQLADLGGAVIGSFRGVGRGRFEGTRRSDGATMYLSR